MKGTWAAVAVLGLAVVVPAPGQAILDSLLPEGLPTPTPSSVVGTVTSAVDGTIGGEAGGSTDAGSGPEQAGPDLFPESLGAQPFALLSALDALWHLFPADLGQNPEFQHVRGDLEDRLRNAQLPAVNLPVPPTEEEARCLAVRTGQQVEQSHPAARYVLFPVRQALGAHGPDLEVDVLPPGRWAEGTDHGFETIVANVGGMDGGAFTLRYTLYKYYPIDPQPWGRNWQIVWTAETRVPCLLAGDSVRVLSDSWPVQHGIYGILVEADRAMEVEARSLATEPNSNREAFGVRVADLAVELVSSPDCPPLDSWGLRWKAGMPMCFDVLVRNVGDASAPQTGLRAALYRGWHGGTPFLDETTTVPPSPPPSEDPEAPGSSVPPPTLSPGGSYSFHVSIPAGLAAGSYYITAYANLASTAHTFPEPNYYDNEVMGAFSIFMPDLVPADLKPASNCVGAWNQGSRPHCFTSSVREAGRVESGPFQFRMTVVRAGSGETVIDETAVVVYPPPVDGQSNQPAGNTHTYQFRLPALPPGSYDVRLRADSEDRVAESNENNNVAEAHVVVNEEGHMT